LGLLAEDFSLREDVSWEKGAGVEDSDADDGFGLPVVVGRTATSASFAREKG
jgi:hypothetical protein